MKNKSSIIFIKLFLLFELIQITFQKSNLTAHNISNNGCDSSGKYSFNIITTLNGNLSQKMIENYKFNAKALDYRNISTNLNINCFFPEINKNQNDNNIDINCTIENAGYFWNVTIYLEGESSQIQLNNFNEIFSNIKTIDCRPIINITLNEINETKCHNNRDYSYFSYIITILYNDIIPKELFSNKIYLMFQSEYSHYYYYNTYCYFTQINNKIVLECNINDDIKLDTLYYDKNVQHIYENSYELYILNNNNNLYIGQNIICYHERNDTYLDIFNGYCKNGAYFFSIDFNKFLNKNEDDNKLIIKNKLLLEFNGKIGSAQKKKLLLFR